MTARRGRIGAPLIFERLWEACGFQGRVDQALGDRHLSSLWSAPSFSPLCMGLARPA